MGSYYDSSAIRNEISKMYPKLDRSEVASVCYMLLSNPRMSYVSNRTELQDMIRDILEEYDEIDGILDTVF